ncbi:class D sortase [Mesobacillus subterraneus]|uniref:class D sortase n=1 Tax=Mesobacillus subterraneus TaxID=285983 RepID=UPI00203A41BF|nr:class D sortase [Mesobacillus subterraneus]MCM3663272.1 class D sortase [Mesobacillus subterraneus]MCM3683046.1 class D sortase [Mesobacillus subterraneus]
MKKILSLLLILSGISIFFYPAMKDFYTSYNQKKIIENWEDSSTGRSDAASSLGELEKVFSGETHAETIDPEKEDEEIAAVKTVDNPKLSSGMVGVIEIDKIKLKMPIFNGASMKNLDLGSGLLEGTALPGMPGNSAIAAHRSRAFGQMFNRLNEIGPGDTVTLKDKNQTYQYEVFETLVVEPNDVSVLEGDDDEKILTLITCTPVDTATHRLIVKARIP